LVEVTLPDVALNELCEIGLQPAVELIESLVLGIARQKLGAGLEPALPKSFQRFILADLFIAFGGIFERGSCTAHPSVHKHIRRTLAARSAVGLQGVFEFPFRAGNR